MAKKILVLVLAVLFCNGCKAKMECFVVPVPREYSVVDACNIVIDTNTIILYNGHNIVQSYAADSLGDNLKKHFNLEVGLNGDANKAKVSVVMGVPGKDAFVRQLCETHKIDINLPGSDGFALKAVRGESGAIVVIAGANERGVTYGANVFFDLLKIQNNKLTCPAVYIRDWATLAWRGRPSEFLDLHDAETLDVYVRSRINFIDVRDANTPGRSAQFGFLPGEPIDTARVKGVIDGAHKRGIFVYGTVSCGVTPDKFDAVIDTFKQLIGLGVDGLWISYDDPGMGTDAPKLFGRVMEFAKQHNITPDKIVVTPAVPAYQVIDNEWNKSIVAVGGAEKMRWIFTRVPQQRDADMMKQLGFAGSQCWWHNWPRPTGGLLHTAAGGRKLYAGKNPVAYYELLPLSAGWHWPQPDELNAVPNYTDMVLYWQTCPAEYASYVFGFWAWNPKMYDFKTVSDSAYAYVFGESQAADARRFDENLVKLKTYFTTPVYKNTGPDLWPPRLTDVNNRAAALKILDEMEKSLNNITAKCVLQTRVSRQRLISEYLEPMKDIILYGRKMATLDYPDYKYSQLREQMLSLAAKNDVNGIETMLERVGPEIEKECQAISVELKDIRYVEQYTKKWTDYVKDANYWMTQAQSERKREKSRNKAKARFDAVAENDFGVYMADWNKPSDGKVVLTIMPDEIDGNKVRAEGEWISGIYKSQAGKALLVGSSAESVHKKGEKFIITIAEIKMPAYNKHLYLEFNAAQKMCAGEKAMRQGSRFVGLDLQQWSSWKQHIGEKRIWNQDVTGLVNSFHSIDITDMANPGEELRIRFFVEDKAEHSGCENMILISRICIVEK